MQQRMVRLSSFRAVRKSLVSDMSPRRMSTRHRAIQRSRAFLGREAAAESSGSSFPGLVRNTSSRPSWAMRPTVSGFLVSRVFSTSSRTRSAAREEARGAFWEMAARVSSAMEKSSRAEKRRALNMRRASSSKRLGASPTQRMQRRRISSSPP